MAMHYTPSASHNIKQCVISERVWSCVAVVTACLAAWAWGAGMQLETASWFDVRVLGRVRLFFQCL